MNYVIRVTTPARCVASLLQLSMAIKQDGPRQRTVWGSPARAFVAKSPDNIVEANITPARGPA